MGVYVLLPKTATTSLAPASRGCDAGPLLPAALVVPGHPPRPAAWRSVYRAGILGDFHRPAVSSSGRAKPAADRSWAIPTRPECPVMSRQPGSPSARAACCKTTDWAYEQEFRLVLNPVLDDSFTKGQRTLTYDFNSLKGIVFGIRTTDRDKLEILDIIGNKCRESQRRDFQVFQAYYSPATGDIRCREVPMNLIHQSDSE